MRRKNNSHQQDIDDLKRQNSLLEAQSRFNLKNIFYCHKLNLSLFAVRTLERARANGSGTNEANYEMPVALDNIKSDISSHDSEDDSHNDLENDARRNKRMKPNTY